MPSITLTIDQLCVSPYNVRRDPRATEHTAAMEASLLENGQLLPLVVHPIKGQKNLWGAFAGGRRYRAFRRLIDRGALPADHPIDVIVRDLPPGKLVEQSVAENLIRRDLYVYEIAAAIADAHRRGRTVEQIALMHGQEPIWVRQHIRLGMLAPAIFQAYSDGQLTDAQAQAFAATEDHAVQLSALEQLHRASYPHEKTAEAIRRMLKVGDRELTRLLRFVGEERYRDAGGRFELDLFADDAEARGRVADEGLLRQLADHAQAAMREELRRRAGREDLRFVTEPPRGDYGTDHSLAVIPKTNGLEIDLPVGDIVCWLKPTEDGPPEITWWWASRKAKHGVQAPARARLRSSGAALGNGEGHDAARIANAAIKEEGGVTADGVEIFRSLRRLVMRGFLVWDARAGGSAGIDYLVWSQLRLVDFGATASALGVARLDGVSRDPEIARAHLEAAPAHDVWDEALRELLARPVFQEKDHAASFRAWRREPAALKQLAAAVVAGMALERSLNAHGYQVPAHDALAAECGVAGVHEQSIRQLWSPTPELLGRLPREQLLAIAEPFVEPSTIASWRAAKVRASDLPPLVAKVLAGVSTAYRAARDQLAARQWVHPLLRFAAPGAPPEPVDAAAAIIDDDAMLERAAG